ncbi:MAG: hypothetical protein ACOH5I_03755 [Oligoflexus sp.]
MRLFFILAIFGMSMSISSQAMAVTAKLEAGKKEATHWAYDSVRERAESQIRIRRLQHMLDQNGSFEAERQLMESIKRDNAKR